MNPHQIELLLVRAGPTTDRRALARDAERGLLTRVRSGVYVERTAWDALTPEGRHVVAMRALAAVAPEPPVFSHWSAAVLHGLPVLLRDLRQVHVAVESPSNRGLVGVAAHVMPIGPDDVVPRGRLRSTTASRTVVDIARTAPFEVGVMVADGALRSGLDRSALFRSVADAVERRGARRAETVAAFARAESESAAESRSRVTMLRLGVEPPVLQFEVFDGAGLAGRLDFWFPHARVGGEVDGESKYRELAKDGAATAVIREKRREDRVRRTMTGLARWGWPESGSTARLGPILAAAGVHPASPPAAFADYCTAHPTAKAV